MIAGWAMMFWIRQWAIVKGRKDKEEYFPRAIYQLNGRERIFETNLMFFFSGVVGIADYLWVFTTTYFSGDILFKLPHLSILSIVVNLFLIGAFILLIYEAVQIALLAKPKDLVMWWWSN